MKWGYPELLPWLLLLLPLAWLVMALARRHQQRLQRLIATELIPVLAPALDPRRLRRRNVLWLMAFSFAALSLARPQWGFQWQEVKRRGLDIVVVLDTSRSMLTQDIKPDRLQQAKWGIRDLVRKLKGDRIGLVTFAGSSFLECPLTMDYAAFLMTLDDVYVGIIPKGGTAIAQALRTAADSFKEETQADRAIVLITDGEDHEGNPLSLVGDLKKQNIRVYAVGVGTAEGELIPDDSGSGFVKDREGNVVKSALHEDVLGQLAIQTDGAYVRSAAGDFGLDRIFDEGIAQLKRDEQDGRMIKAHEDRFTWPLGLSILALAAEAALSRRKLREDAP
ncbi:MAG TPA: VWA domain-containing protein [Kiritimatiellia bacterium]|nr:VWA domain-containing protein [Kiritimatiellia bacterium]